MERYRNCMLCPRMCGVDRTAGSLGACRSGALPRVAHTMLHMWEEPCISGKNGSGIIFFSGCPLGCVYCQNHKISRSYVGAEYDAEALSELFLSLESRGAHNINLVTATQYIPHLCAAIPRAREKGFSLPIVYNTSGYERRESLALLAGFVDIFLTDVRYHNASTAKKYSFASDYPHVAISALEEMLRLVGDPLLDGDGMLLRGVIVRLLLLPGHLIEAKQILKEVYTRFGDHVYISLMSQYTPVGDIAEKAPELDRRVTPYEYASLVAYAQSLGVRMAFTQSGEAAEESFIPDFLGEMGKTSLQKEK